MDMKWKVLCYSGKERIPLAVRAYWANLNSLTLYGGFIADGPKSA